MLAFSQQLLEKIQCRSAFALDVFTRYVFQHSCNRFDDETSLLFISFSKVLGCKLFKNRLKHCKSNFDKPGEILLVKFLTDQMSTFPANVDSEIQPVVEPDEFDPPESIEETKKTKADKKVKQKKKSKSDVEAAIGNPWTTGLFNCHEDRTNAVVTAFLPCITFGQIAEVLDEGKLTSPWGSFIYLLMMPALCSQWIMGSKYRKKLRKKYDLVEAPYTDKVSHIFCLSCSLCQDYRELKNRGLDPSLGWKGILAQQKGKQTEDQLAQTPPANQEMVM